MKLLNCYDDLMNILLIPVSRNKEKCIEVHIFSLEENNSRWHHTISIIRGKTALENVHNKAHDTKRLK
jgi:hypothetical protein